MGFQKRMHMQQLTVSFALTRGGEIFQSQSSLVLTGCVMCLIGAPFQRPAGGKEKSKSKSFWRIMSKSNRDALAPLSSERRLSVSGVCKLSSWLLFFPEKGKQ